MANVTLLHIAEESGVSYSTVSRILNGKVHLYKPETVKRVLETANEMGYRPNLLARSIKSGRTHTIGIIFPHGSRTFVNEIQAGIHDELSDRDYIPITLHPTQTKTEMEQVYHLLDRRVEGIIVSPVVIKTSNSYIDEIVNRGIPVVSVNREIADGIPLDFVGTDDERGARLAAEHLVDIGHRRLGILGYQNEVSENRSDAFERCAQRTQNVRCQKMLFIGRDEEVEREAAKELLGELPRPTAVFAIGDQLACRVYQAAAELGLSIPEDLSVVGFADLEYARLMIPPLTTIRQDPHRIGQEAARLVVERIEGATVGAAPQKIKLKPQIVVRASTANVNEVLAGEKV